MGGSDASTIAPKLPYLGQTDILFMTMIMSLPQERRPWGMVTWMADMFMLARRGLYDLIERVQERLLLPMALDGFTQLFGFRTSNWELQTLTGVIFGVGTIWFARCHQTHPRLRRRKRCG